MFVAVLTDDIGQRMHVLLRVGMVQAPLQKHEGEKDNGKPLFGRFVRLDPKVGQAQMLFDVKVVHLDGRSCTFSLRLNTRGLSGDHHRSKKVPSIGPSCHLSDPLPLVTPSQPGVRTHVAYSDQPP